MAFALPTVLSMPAFAAELVMYTRDGCPFCMRFEREVAPIYPKTAEGKAAPLRRVELLRELRLGRFDVLVDGVRVRAMKARELGRKGIVVGDQVSLVGDVSGDPDALARIVRREARATLLRRTADDTDPVERVLVTGIQDALPFPKNVLYPLKARKEKTWVDVPLGGRVHSFARVVRAQSPEPKPVTLSPADLASRHHLSVRYVHALFTESGISCAALRMRAASSTRAWRRPFPPAIRSR